MLEHLELFDFMQKNQRNEQTVVPNSNLRQLYLLKLPRLAYLGPNKILFSKINFFHAWEFTIIWLHAKNSKKIMNGVPDKAIYNNFFGWNSPSLPILGQINIFLKN